MTVATTTSARPLPAPHWRRLADAAATFAGRPTHAHAHALREARDAVRREPIPVTPDADQRVFAALTSVIDAVRPRTDRRRRLAAVIGALAREALRLLDGRADGPEPDADTLAGPPPYWLDKED